MDKCINFQRFMRYLLDDKKLAEKGARITKALVEPAVNSWLGHNPVFIDAAEPVSAAICCFWG